MTTIEKIRAEIDCYLKNNEFGTEYRNDIKSIIDKYAEQEPCDDVVSRQAVLDKVIDAVDEWDGGCNKSRATLIEKAIRDLPPIRPQEPKTDKYEYHTDHTDCIWYGNDSGCPVTCSQYRDGWNDAMDYIFKNGKGYQPYRHDG